MLACRLTGLRKMLWSISVVRGKEGTVNTQPSCRHMFEHHNEESAFIPRGRRLQSCLCKEHKQQWNHRQFPGVWQSCSLNKDQVLWRQQLNTGMMLTQRRGVWPLLPAVTFQSEMKWTNVTGNAPRLTGSPSMWPTCKKMTENSFKLHRCVNSFYFFIL